jgi:hypothetical protein
MVYLNTDTINMNDNIKPYLEEELNRFIDQFINMKIDEKDSRSNKTNEYLDARNDLNHSYSFVKLLKKHNIFNNIENNILPKTCILDEYLALEKGLERKNIISYSLINNKMYQRHLDTLKKFEEEFLQKSFKSFKSGENKNENIDINETVQYILKLFENYEKLLAFFIKAIVGFNDLSLDYQAKIIKRNLIDFIIIFCLNFYEEGEIKIYLENGVQTTRNLLTKLRGKSTIDLQYDALDSLNDLKLTEKERVCLLAYILFMPGNVYILNNN